MPLIEDDHLSNMHEDSRAGNSGDRVDLNAIVPYFLLGQTVDIEIDFLEKSIRGFSELQIAPHKDDLDEIQIDARQCTIDITNITVNGYKATAYYDDPHAAIAVSPGWNWSVEQHHIQLERMEETRKHYPFDCPTSDPFTFGCQPVHRSLRVKIPRQASRDRNGSAKNKSRADVMDGSEPAVFIVKVPFKIKNPADGYQFIGVDFLDSRYPHLYTKHSIAPGTACSLFPTVDDNCSAPHWKISITVPKTLGHAMGQPPSSANSASDSEDRTDGESGLSIRPLATSDRILEMTVVCVGLLSDESSTDTKKTMTFEINTEHGVPAKYIGFAVGPFEHVDLWSALRSEDEEEHTASQGLKIHGYCLPGRNEEVQNVSSVLVHCADHLMLAIGKYAHWEHSFKLCFVDDMVQETVPLVSFALCSNRILFDDKIIDFDIPVLRQLAYCIAWQYSGVSLMPDRPEDSWVVYGIAAYLTEMVVKHLCGDNEYRFHMKTLVDRLVTEDNGQPSLKSHGSLLGVGPKQVDFMKLKSAIVMFILDNRLAKKKASKGLIRVISRIFMKVKSFAGGGSRDITSDRCISSGQFRERCEKFGDINLESFWAQWIEGSGCPQFDLTQRFNKKRLCVELVVRQVHHPSVERKMARPPKKRAMMRHDFWYRLLSYHLKLESDNVPPMFTGPMTIKIHEADGTPYEHTVEIREDPNKLSKFEIPYNTKYKRIKRNRRHRERLANQSGTFEDGGENADDQVIYMLGDVLQSKEDVENWLLAEWTPEQERAMDQESYEWIRFDADFEWSYEMQSNMPSYMHISQLQQDRDVAAQQESLLYLRNSKPSPLNSTFLVRSVMDKRYFWGIREFAAQILAQQNGAEMSMIGAKHLMRAFQELFCYPGTTTPKPNDFQDKRDYFVQLAIIKALARVRDTGGKTDRQVSEFLLTQLKLNDNKENYFSDTYYVATLIESLAISLVPGDPDLSGARPKEKERDLELLSFEQQAERAMEKEFIAECVSEIERYRRMDEWRESFRNMWTVAAFEAMMRLMKAGVIPHQPVYFLMYLQDQTAPNIRIKGFECLAKLGHLFDSPLLTYFITCYTTERSAYVREELFHVLCIALAGIAFGEDMAPQPSKMSIVTSEPPGGDVTMADTPSAFEIDPMADDDDTFMGLVVEASEDVAKKREFLRERVESVEVAVKCLRSDLADLSEVKRALWKMANSRLIGWDEKQRLYTLFAHIFDRDYTLELAVQYPLRWTVIGKEASVKKGLDGKPKKELLVTFKSYYKTKPSEKTFSSQLAEPTTVAIPATHKPGLNRTISLSVKKDSKSTTNKPSQPKQPASPPQSIPNITSPQESSIKEAQESSSSNVNAFSLRPHNPKPHEAHVSSGAQHSHSLSSSARPIALPRQSSLSARTSGQVKTAQVKPQTNGNRQSILDLNKPKKRERTDGQESSRPAKIARLVRLNIGKMPKVAKFLRENRSSMETIASRNASERTVPSKLVASKLPSSSIDKGQRKEGSNLSPSINRNGSSSHPNKEGDIASGQKMRKPLPGGKGPETLPGERMPLLPGRPSGLATGLPRPGLNNRSQSSDLAKKTSNSKPGMAMGRSNSSSASPILPGKLAMPNTNTFASSNKLGSGSKSTLGSAKPTAKRSLSGSPAPGSGKITNSSDTTLPSRPPLTSNKSTTIKLKLKPNLSGASSGSPSTPKY